MPITNLKDAHSNALGAEITELFGLITAATYELLVKIREFDQAKLWESEGLCSCAHWLNWQCGIGMNAGREKVRVANSLGELRKISEAFCKGEISYSKVRAITRVATPESEDYLLMIARHGTAHHVETLVRGYRRAQKLSEAGVAECQFESREFDYRWDDDGSLVFKGRLPAEVGAMLMKAIDRAVDHADKDVTAETREPVAARRADAIAEMAESYLSNGPAKSSSADRYQVMLHVSAETPEGPAHIEDGPHVTAETSQRICCDTSTSLLVEDENGEPLSIGRKSRVIPPAMRRALKARDKQCRFPGCTHTHFIDGHHIKHWSDGGETGLDNLVQLCRHHHRLVHEGGFDCAKNAEGKVEFRNQDGILLGTKLSNMPRYRGNVVAELNYKLEDRHIHAQTCVSRWDGERMDLGLAVSGLWDLNHSTGDASDRFAQ
jgi:hypothetical protein